MTLNYCYRTERVWQDKPSKSAKVIDLASDGYFNKDTNIMQAHRLTVGKSDFIFESNHLVIDDIRNSIYKYAKMMGRKYTTTKQKMGRYYGLKIERVE